MAIRPLMIGFCRVTLSHLSRAPAIQWGRFFSQSDDRERYNYIFNKSVPQPKLAALDTGFRQKAFQLVSADKPLTDFSHEEQATAAAFVAYDEDFQREAQQLRESKKPIEELTPKERRIMEFYVNFDKEFREIIEEVEWRDYPTEDVDEIRTLYVNFNTKFKEKVGRLTSGYFDQNEKEKRESFLCVNYHRQFQERARTLIKDTREFDHLNEEEKRTLKAYINLHRGFEEQARALINGFRTHESLSDEEKKIIQLFVRYNLEHRKDILEGSKESSFKFTHNPRFYNYTLSFDQELLEKTQRLLWGRRRFEDLLPGEQHVVRMYVNLSDSFKRADAFKEDSFGNSFYRHAAGRSLFHFSRRTLRTFESFMMCDERYLQEAKELVYGDKEISDFTPHENGIVRFYVHHNDDFQKQMNQLLTKSFEHLTSAEKRIFCLSYKFDTTLTSRLDNLVQSIKRPELFTPEEFKLIVLYVNCIKSFREKATKLISTKKKYSDFSLEEERIGVLYVNFDTNFQIEAQKLIGEHHKKGGLHDIDQKLCYPPMLFHGSKWSPLKHFFRDGHFVPKGELFAAEGEVSPEPEAVAAPPPSPLMVDFTPQEDITIRLYVHFHFNYRNMMTQILRGNRRMNTEEKRILHLGMWYDQELRENIFSITWDKAKAQKIIDATSEDLCWGLDVARDWAHKDKYPKTSEEWTYFFLGQFYYKIPIRPG